MARPAVVVRTARVAVPVDAAAYAQLVLENQGRTLSVQDAAVELGRLRAIPLPPRAGEELRV